MTQGLVEILCKNANKHTSVCSGKNMKYARGSIAHQQQELWKWWWCQEIFFHNSQQSGCSWWEGLDGVYSLILLTSWHLNCHTFKCMWHIWGLIGQTSHKHLFYITYGRNVEQQRRFLCCIVRWLLGYNKLHLPDQQHQNYKAAAWHHLSWTFVKPLLSQSSVKHNLLQPLPTK